MSHPAGPRFTVLHVCTGNICRSPMAERIMLAELDARFGPRAADGEVLGAGTYGGHAGSPMNPPAARVLGEMGIDFTDLHTSESSLEEIFVSLVRAPA